MAPEFAPLSSEASRSPSGGVSFLKHVEAGAWSVAPVGDRVLRRVSRMLRLAPASLYLRSGDAVHLATALEIGEVEVWTSDQHMLAAAPHFGLAGRTA